MSAAKPYIRINFQLPADLASEFSDFAKQSGITKAKLLRDWVRAYGALEIPRSNFDPTIATSFNLRTGLDLASMISIRAKANKLRRSAYLRGVITIALAAVKSEKPSGSSRLRIVTTSNNWEQLNLLNYRQVVADSLESMDKGDLETASSLMDHLEQKYVAQYRENEVFAYIDLVKGQIARHRRNLDLSERLLENALEICLNTQCSIDCWQRVHDQLSVLAEIREDIDKAIWYTQQSQTLAGHSLKLSERYYLRLASLYSQKFNKSKALGYLAKVKTSQVAKDNSRNSRESIRRRNRKAVVLTRLGYVSEARGIFEQLKTEAKQAGYAKEQRYISEALAMMDASEGKHSVVVASLARVIQQETKFRGAAPCLSKTKLIYYYSLAALGNEQALADLKAMVRLQHRPTYQGLGEFYLYSALNEFGKRTDRLPAQQRLNQLLTSAPGYVKAAIENPASALAL